MNFNKSVHYIAVIFAIFVGFGLVSCGESAPAGGEKMGVSVPAGEGEDLRQVQISTEFGEIVVELSNQTPQHRDNFIELVENGFYDSLLFHRVINEFMIQGGDPASRTASLSTPLGSGGPGYKIPAEITTDLLHYKGALAAARQGDDVNPEELGQSVLSRTRTALFKRRDSDHRDTQFRLRLRYGRAVQVLG